MEFTPVGGLKGGGGGMEGRAEPHRDTVSPSAPKLLFQSPPTPTYSPPRGFPKSTLWKYIYKKSCKKEELLLSVVHLGNDSDAGLSFLYQ